MAKIKIALCITDLDLGGAERCLTHLALNIDRNRFEPVVYCLGPRPTRERASCLPPLEAAGIEVHCLDGRGIWQFLKVEGCLKRLLTSQSPHIVQTFLFHANVLGRIAARRAGVKIVLSGIRVAEREKRWHLWLDRLTQSKVDRYVCVSHAVANFSAMQTGLPATKIVVIPNGINLKTFTDCQAADLASLGIGPKRRVVTFIGRLETQKGVQWLIETAPAWLKQCPNADLLIVGEGPQEDGLKSFCKAAGIAQRVHFTGWRADIPEILAASTTLVLPSVWEGMPNVVLEAMAAGKPVVATDVEGIRELLGPSWQLQTVSYGDTQALISKLLDFLQDPIEATFLGEQNRRRVEENYSLSQMVTAYQDLWESLVTQ